MSPEMIDLTFAERVPEGCAMMVVGVGAVVVLVLVMPLEVYVRGTRMRDARELIALPRRPWYKPSVR